MRLSSSAAAVSSLALKTSSGIITIWYSTYKHVATHSVENQLWATLDRCRWCKKLFIIIMEFNGANHAKLECQKSEPFAQNATGAPKVRTLCSKWQLERQKYEPFARNGSWNAQSPNPLLKMAAGTLKYKPFARNGSWSAQSTNPVPKIQAGASKVQLELKASCSTFGLLPIMP